MAPVLLAPFNNPSATSNLFDAIVHFFTGPSAVASNNAQPPIPNANHPVPSHGKYVWSITGPNGCIATDTMTSVGNPV